MKTTANAKNHIPVFVKISIFLIFFVSVFYFLLVTYVMNMDYRHSLMIENDSNNDLIIQKIVINNNILFDGEYIIHSSKKKTNNHYYDNIKNWKRRKENILYITIKYKSINRYVKINLIDEKDRGCIFKILYRKDGGFVCSCEDIYRMINDIEEYPWWIGM